MYNKSTRHRDTAKNEPYCCSTRARDTVASDAVTEFIYENLYQKVYKEPYVVENRVAQRAGVDIWDADTNITIDEKCRLSDIEKGMLGHTFAIELGWISNQRNGEHVRLRGWGLSSYSSPTYYNFIWLGKVGVISYLYYLNNIFFILCILYIYDIYNFKIKKIIHKM